MSAARLLFVSIALLAAPAAAQAVHVVDASGGGAFLDIQSAVDAASSGDLVLVKSGSYARFTIDGKGLFVLADEGARVVVTGTIIVQDVPSQEEVVVHGFRARLTSGLSAGGLSVRDCEGHVLAQDFDVFAGPFVTAVTGILYVADSDAFALTNSVLNGEGDYDGLAESGALTSIRSNSFVHDLIATGSKGADAAFPKSIGCGGGHGIQITGGSVLLVGSSIRGGGGGAGMEQAIPGNGGPGGSGASLVSDAPPDPTLVVYDTNAQGGPGGTALPPATEGASGSPFLIQAGTVEQPIAKARRLTVPPVIRNGEPVNVLFQGEPFDLVWQMIAVDANSSPVYQPEILGAVHPGGSPSVILFRGVLDETGTLNRSMTLGAVGQDFVPIYQQAFTYNATEGFVASNPRFSAMLELTTP